MTMTSHPTLCTPSHIYAQPCSPLTCPNSTQPIARPLFPLSLPSHCHNHDITPQPSHTYSCLLAVQTPPKHSLIKPKTHPRPSQSIYSILKLICSIPEGMLHQHLLSKHSQSGEHHSRIHLTISDEPKTPRIPSTNPELARSPLNPKTQYTQPRSGKA